MLAENRQLKVCLVGTDLTDQSPGARRVGYNLGIGVLQAYLDSSPELAARVATESLRFKLRAHTAVDAADLGSEYVMLASRFGLSISGP